MAKHKVASVFPSLYLLILTSLLSSCSSAPTSNDPRDPIENFNRSSWRFTWDYADKYVTKPLAESYVENVSPDVRTGIYNMALNLNEPATIINHLLQAKFTEAAKSAGRFTLNSTIGLLGFFDPASRAGILPLQWHPSNRQTPTSRVHSAEALLPARCRAFFRNSWHSIVTGQSFAFLPD